MNYIVHVSKLIEIFCSCDDFMIAFEQLQAHYQLPHKTNSKPTRIPQMAASEIMTICIFYHLSGFKCFEYYYRQIILIHLKDYFPKAVSYERFVSLQSRYYSLLYLYLNSCRYGKHTGIYYADSKKLPVCDNRRIHQHKTFYSIANRGKSSTGWFFGFKVFLIINQHGQLINMRISKASKADNNYEWMQQLFKNIKGYCFTDKGFISAKFFEQALLNGLKIITGIRTKMKNKLIDMTEKLLHKKRGIIESVNDILMTVCDIDHTRHRSPYNFMVNLISGTIAYTFLDKLPSIFNKKFSLCNP